MAEERAKGRRIVASLLGNNRGCLPLVEIDVSNKKKVCPALLDETLAERVRNLATTAFRALGCRDYARVDLRLGPAGQVWVESVHQVGILARHGAFALAAASAGHTHTQLLRLIVEEARKKYSPRAIRKSGPPAARRTGERPAPEARALTSGMPGNIGG